MVNVIEAMDIFLMNNSNTYKMFGICLILLLLKMTGVTLEKISDPDKYMFFE